MIMNYPSPPSILKTTKKAAFCQEVSNEDNGDDLHPSYWTHL